MGQLCNGIPYSKEQELQIHPRTWTDLKNFTLSKRCQTQRSQNCNSIYMTFKNRWQKYRIVVIPWGQWLGRAGESLRRAKKCSLSWFSGGCFHGSVCTLTHLCPTLCNPMDCSLPGSSVHGISQARKLGCYFLLQGIFPTWGSNLSLLHRQVDSLPLSHLGELLGMFIFFYDKKLASSVYWKDLKLVTQHSVRLWALNIIHLIKRN